jgi:hypothetical protein
MASNWYDTQRLLRDTLPDGSWKNEPCYILGGGPSLKDFDLSETFGRRVIAVNRAYEICPWADLIVSCDDCFYAEHKDEPRFRRHKGLKVMMLVDPNPHLEEDVRVVPGIIERCIGSIQDGLGHGWNSGYGALMLAAALGCAPIYLIGFDMQGDLVNDTQVWWHDGYGKRNNKSSCYPRYAEEFKWAAASGLLSQRLYSLCPTGGLRDTFPRPEPVFVNYYTPGRGYEPHAERLVKSLLRLGCVYDQEVLDDPGGWLKAQACKPGFIQRKLKQHFPHPIIWVDADAIIRRRPTLFYQWADEGSGPDIGVHYKEGEECLSGTVWLKQSGPTRDLLARWVALQQRNPEEWDQRLLEQAINEDERLRVGRLPATYCQIFDSMRDAGEPVIEHFQHSRQLKKEAWSQDREQ